MKSETLTPPLHPDTVSRNFGKRLFDICFSLVVLLLLSPFFFAVTLAIRLSSPGKALYAQERIGRGGRLFKCYKFRTMDLDAEEKLEKILATSPHLRKEWETYHKLKNDPRVLPLGKWLRKTSLDELPQFWNVLKGDLSVVGPRPYTMDKSRALQTSGYPILSVRPGITGLWQTSGRNQTTFQRRMELDAAYATHRTFWLDLLLIVKTIPLLFFPKNAY